MFGKKKEMSDSEKKAKLAALKGAHDMASDAMKDGLDNVKKVSIVSDSKKGLQKGLDTAEKLLGQKDQDDQVEGDDMETEASDYGDQQDEADPMSEEEIDAEIEHLMKLKEHLQNC